MVVVLDAPSERPLQRFPRNLSYIFPVIERTRFCDRQTHTQTDRQTQGESNIIALCQFVKLYMGLQCT